MDFTDVVKQQFIETVESERDKAEDRLDGYELHETEASIDKAVELLEAAESIDEIEEVICVLLDLADTADSNEAAAVFENASHTLHDLITVV